MSDVCPETDIVTSNLDDEEELELLLQKQSYLLELDALLEELELLLEELLLDDDELLDEEDDDELHDGLEGLM